MQRSKDGVSSDSPVARLYELHATPIFAYLRRQTASREDAEDLLVEVFVAAIESSAFDRLGEKEQVAWLWRLAHNKAVDAYRRSQLRHGIDLELVANVLLENEKLGEGEAWTSYITALREQNRNLRALKEELAAARL